MHAELLDYLETLASPIRFGLKFLSKNLQDLMILLG